MINRYLYYME